MPDSNADRAPRVLVLRPAHQATPFIEACRQAGFHPVSLPTLAIEAVDPAPSFQEPNRGLVIFTSVNAVAEAARLAPLPWPSVQALAIGPATHAALESLGQTMAAAPTAPYNSEAMAERLLQQPALTTDGKVTIVTGRDSRSLLADRLIDAGLDIQTHAIYRRVLPAMTEAEVMQRLSPLPDILCVPSNEALDNLMTLAATLRDQLQGLPMILNSQRAAEHARKRGFNAPLLVASAAGDEGQLMALQRWRAQRD